MGPKLIDRTDHVEVVNQAGRWYIATTAAGVGYAGPGYVYKLVRRSTGQVLVDDSLRGRGFINDPDYGGLGVFGWQHARRLDRHGLGPDDEFGAANPGATSAWLQNNAWPIDGRTLAAKNDGFGVSEVEFVQAVRYERYTDVAVMSVYSDPWDAVLCRTLHSWRFFPVRVLLTVMASFSPTLAGPQAFLKEPKLGLALGEGARVEEIRCGYARSERGLPLTAQASPRSRTAEFIGSGLTVKIQDIFPRWVEHATTRSRFGDHDGPGDDVVWDCHGGTLRQRYELIGWRKGNRFSSAAILLTGWEGGRGPYDCEPLSRAMVAEAHTAHLELALAA